METFISSILSYKVTDVIMLPPPCRHPSTVVQSQSHYATIGIKPLNRRCATTTAH